MLLMNLFFSFLLPFFTIQWTQSLALVKSEAVEYQQGKYPCFSHYIIWGKVHLCCRHRCTQDWYYPTFIRGDSVLFFSLLLRIRKQPPF